MDRLDLRCGQLIEPGTGIGPQPGGREVDTLSPSGFGEEFFFVFSLRRIVSQSQISNLLYRAIALLARDHRAVRHAATMTFRAGRLGNFQLAPLPNDEGRKRADAVSVVQVAGLRDKCATLFRTGRLWAEENRRVEDHLTGLDPVRLGHQQGTVRAVIPNNDRLLLPEPFL